MSTRHRFAALAITLTLAGSATLRTFSQSSPRQAPASSHVSILEGAANFRDIGGYVTADGRHVRKGLVYRSGQLSGLTPRDYETLNALGIKLVCDFRTDGERRRQPTEWQGGPAPEMIRAQIIKGADVNISPERIRELASRATSSSSLSSAYDSMVSSDAAAEYGQLFKRIAAGQLPVIAHCSAGKDRTGVFSAVLLTLLNVPRASVIEDYMLTGEYMASPRAVSQATKDMQKALGTDEGLNEDAVRAIYTMHAEVLTNTFATIDRQYGSFDSFVRDGLRLTPAEVAALRANLLQ